MLFTWLNLSHKIVREVVNCSHAKRHQYEKISNGHSPLFGVIIVF
jgi:hypothetical protein